MNTTKKLLDNGKVEVTTVTEMPRYTGFHQGSSELCKMIMTDFTDNNKVWITPNEREGFKGIMDTKEDWEPEKESVEKDIESFQKYLDETYGKDKYEAYALGAYIHSAVSFAFNKSEDNRCQWDSGTIGFVGIAKDMYTNLNAIASELSDSWNGWIEEIGIFDNLTDEVVDSIISTESVKYINEWKAKMKEEYGVEDYQDQN